MTRRPPTPPPSDDDLDDEDEDLEPRGPVMVNVISAEGAFRLLLILLTVWTLFEGVALATGAFSPVDSGTDRTAERMLGGLMIVLGGVYAMIAWQREHYRLLLWVPFAAQLALVVPLLIAFPDGALLLVISGMFLALMCYVWWRSRELEETIDYDDDEDTDDSGADASLPVRDAATGARSQPATGRAKPPQESARRTRSFRRRDS